MTGNLTNWASSALSRAVGLLRAEVVRAQLTPPAHPGASHVFDIDSERGIGQFIVWPDGSTEATILNIATEAPVYFEDAPVSDLTELDVRFRAFLDAFLENEKPSS